MMKKLPQSISFDINPLGEFRMGCEAFGLTINTPYGHFELFKEMPILINTTHYNNAVELSTCQRYLLLHGAFDLFILDLQEQRVSVYRVTIRTPEGRWSEEQAIYGDETMHLNGFSRHYYLQFPFVEQSHFLAVFNQFKAMRIQQIQQAMTMDIT